MRRKGSFQDYGRNKNESERNKPLFGLTGKGE